MNGHDFVVSGSVLEGHGPRWSAFMVLLALRFLDVAILFSMGGLWLAGAVFVYAVMRWVIRYERLEARPEPPAVAPPRDVPSPSPTWPRGSRELARGVVP